MKKTLLILLILAGLKGYSQVNTDSLNRKVNKMDTTIGKMDRVMGILREFRISAYAQVEWQHADTAATASVAGGNFPANVDNRFLIRRGRFKIGYEHKVKAMSKLYKGENDSLKLIETVLQFDITEKGFNAVKDFYGKIIDPWTGWVGFQGGIFLRPFGMETPASPAYWDSPEFARVNQTIMNNEVELGGAIVIESPEPFIKKYGLDLRLDAGLFNGEGVGTADPLVSGSPVVTGTYMSRKDFIGRIQGTKMIGDNMRFIIGASLYQGNVLQTTKTVYDLEPNSKGALVYTKVLADTSGLNKNYLTRQYFGAHAEFKINYGKGKVQGSTMVRGEFIAGQEPGLATKSNPVISAGDSAGGILMRKFNGAIFYVTQTIKHNIGNHAVYHDFTFKYDWYTPNSQVSQSDLSTTNDAKVSGADIRYSTIGLGYTFRPYNFFKLMIWYDIVNNASTNVKGFTTDLKDNVLTVRTQFMFDTKWYSSASDPNKLAVKGY